MRSDFSAFRIVTQSYLLTIANTHTHTHTHTWINPCLSVNCFFVCTLQTCCTCVHACTHTFAHTHTHTHIDKLLSLSKLFLCACFVDLPDTADFGMQCVCRVEGHIWFDQVFWHSLLFFLSFCACFAELLGTPGYLAPETLNAAMDETNTMGYGKEVDLWVVTFLPLSQSVYTSCSHAVCENQ